MNPLADINVGPILWTIINFFLLLILLRIIAWKPILNALKTRQETITDALNRAEAAKQEADRVLAENQKALRQAEAESQKVLKETREYAQRIQADAMAKAQDDTKKLMEQAHQEIGLSKQQALNELRTEVASLAVGAAEKILNESLDADRHKRLVDDYLKQTANQN
ncbi:MAG: F0F1 ATP synthase subunit B [Chlorobi bacterium]|nr:F0F1 ATP synthase subunit B [Chlorobiota bacterium]